MVRESNDWRASRSRRKMAKWFGLQDYHCIWSVRVRVCVLLVCRSFHKKMLSFVLVISLFELDYITSRGSGYCLLYNVWWCAYKACCCRRRRLFSFNYNQLRMVYWRSNCYVSLSVVIAPPALLFSIFYCWIVN